MIVKYDTETGKILNATYGQDDSWTTGMMTAWGSANSGEGCAKVSDDSVGDKYYNTSSSSIQTFTAFSINQSKTTVTSNGTDYIEFTSVPEDTKIYVDSESALTMDASGIYRMSCTDAGTYEIRFKKYAYDWHYVEIVANDNF